MSTRIELREPYKSKWRSGYLRKSSRTDRMLVDLVNNHSDRTTTSFARYLMSVELGYEVPVGFEVDHIDQDPTNDNLSNLQVLSVEDHILKSSKEKQGRSYTELTCPNCSVSFEIETRNLRPEKIRYFCSRSCNGKFYHGSGFSKRTSDVWKLECEIRMLRLEGHSDYKISDILSVSRASVQRARKKFNIP